MLGELSGLHRELAPGLRAQGVEVTTGHSRLATPDFASDIPFFSPKGSTDRRSVWVRDVFSQLWNAPRLTGFDIVQVVTPKFFNWKIHGPMMRYLARHNGRLVVICTSCISHSFRAFGDLAYRPCEQCLKHDLKTDRCIFDRPDEEAAEDIVFDLASAIVVTEAEYGWVMNLTRYAAKAVPIALPIDTERQRASPMPPAPPVRIWYGETRHGFKGGEVILPALDRIDRSYGERVDIVRTGRMGFEEYLAFLDTVHIVVDQANKYGFGMNGLYALAAGRLVVSGAEPEALAFMGIAEADNAVINIRPDPDHIYDVLARVVDRADELPQLGRRAAEYVWKFHDSKMIAGQYLDLYRRLLGT